MKRIFLLTLGLFALTFSAMAQHVDRSSFKAGFNAGIPVGDASEISKFSIGLDLAYHWSVSELVDIGLASGFINAFGETKTVTVGNVTVENEFEDFQFVPLTGSLRLYPTYDFKLGADVGYAVGINDGNEGGFYVRPSVGYNITGNTELNVSYINISNDGNFSIVALGILFLF
ncbi:MULTISPECIES: hypothetical protein [Flavobacteriaceae]|uniref:Outer membrane protein beta-barrel domain-containing protein n=1 Tax=Flagellimonas alvinocaridis TaxID=2530200 RepID=A0A4S8RJV9_9FLAO|nr:MULTISPECIES: hypothetical protein [Allomuricauda]MDC6363886.1 hypothetical protein [Muricauda sp. SP22]THV58733.1 hypothetical protein EZV76_12040 [Allomuricauda alvinocaridis]